MAQVNASVGFLANRAAWKYRSLLNRIIAQCDYDITVEHWIALYYLYRNHQVSQIELARATYKDRANVTRVIQKLMHRDLVRRSRSVEDQRSFVVSLTENGRKLVSQLQPKLKNVTDAVNLHFGEDRIQNLRNELQALYDFADQFPDSRSID